MKKSIPLTLIAASLVCSVANAGVAEKKILNAANENIVAETQKTKEACESAQLETIVDWDAFKSMAASEENAKKMKENSYKPVWVLDHASQRTVATLKAIARICIDDADYKEELTKITTIKVAPKTALDDYKSEFSISGTSFNINSGHLMTRSYTDFVDPIKAVFE